MPPYSAAPARLRPRGNARRVAITNAPRSKPATTKRDPALQKGSRSRTLTLTAIALIPPNTATATNATSVGASGTPALVVPVPGVIGGSRDAGDFPHRL